MEPILHMSGQARPTKRSQPMMSTSAAGLPRRWSEAAHLCGERGGQQRRLAEALL